jgi:hypothetical protein
MAESSQEESENFDLTGHRKGLFSSLAHVLIISREKFDKETIPNKEKMGWGRLIVQAAEAYGHLLEGIQLEQLEKRVSKLESHGEIENEKQNLGKTNSTP